MIFQIAVKFSWTRNILQKYPDICSAYMFKNSGPTRQQAEEVVKKLFWYKIEICCRQDTGFDKYFFMRGRGYCLDSSPIL